MHENVLAYRPIHPLDGALGDAAIVVEQGHVRRVLRLRPALEPGCAQHRFQPLLKDDQCTHTFVPIKYERLIPRSRRQAERTVEGNLKRWRGDSGYGLGAPSDPATRDRPTQGSRDTRNQSRFTDRSKGVIRSMGKGNTMVELFSLEMSASVCR